MQYEIVCTSPLQCPRHGDAPTHYEFTKGEEGYDASQVWILASGSRVGRSTAYKHSIVKMN